MMIIIKPFDPSNFNLLDAKCPRIDKTTTNDNMEPEWLNREPIQEMTEIRKEFQQTDLDRETQR